MLPIMTLQSPADVLPYFVPFARRGTFQTLPYVTLSHYVPVPNAHRPAGLLAGIRCAARVRVRRNGKLPCGAAIAEGHLLELPGQ
jgi:hypothetical protein